MTHEHDRRHVGARKGRGAIIVGSVGRLTTMIVSVHHWLVMKMQTYLIWLKSANYVLIDNEENRSPSKMR